MQVPPEFRLDVDVLESGEPFRLAIGQVTEPNHSLTGLWVALAERTRWPDHTDYNLVAYTERPSEPFKLYGQHLISGYAQAEVGST